jgi:hypothetical protein
LDDNGELIGFVAGRKIAYRNSIKEAEKIYTKYRGDEYIDNPVFFDEGYNDYLLAHK